MLRRDIMKDVATLTRESIVTYRESLLKDINLKVRITLNEQTYLTKISEWENDMLILAAPLDKLDWVTLPINTRLEITLVSKTALYTTQIEVMTPLKKDGNIYYSCQIVRPLIRKQQRQSFRLDTIIDASYQLLPEETDTLPLNVPHYKGMILNISLGGLCFVSEEQLQADTLIYITFKFLETKLSLTGKVLFTGERTPVGTYSHRVKFMNLSTTDENTLNRLIMTKQRLMRRNL